ncbi:hypothetical protein KI387_005799 [Taxus chinensis]|uniref:Histone RNA hairpin-binding protein RNA-binding domain-containing protein n=1 Tax=Taxus chinensis TaxID=29808 RepID=A0AA38GMB7_TAXCH|nr:hypothetical protein KI387_005799 [Taxus chinensis]
MRIVSVRNPCEVEGEREGKGDGGSSKSWRRVARAESSVLAFPSSKRIQRAPSPNSWHYHSHSQTSTVNITPNANLSVWVKVSDKTANTRSLSCEDLEVSATAKKKIVLDEFLEDTDLVKSEASQMDWDEDSSGLKIVDVSHKFTIKDSAAAAKINIQETDPHKLSQRQKQIDYGKNTLGYERYLELVPRNKRLKGDPQTPETKQVCSKRSWDGQVKKWRRCLHEFDPPQSEDEVSPKLFSVGGRSDTSDEEDREENAAQPESNPAPQAGVLSIYEDWDEMEP